MKLLLAQFVGVRLRVSAKRMPPIPRTPAVEHSVLVRGGAAVNAPS